jgi:LysR family transcriptional regulator for bpeEF and oprC
MEVDLSRIFVKVIQNGSFSKAAELLKLPNSAVSRAISKLEYDSGTKLIIRTTRSLRMTEAGRKYYEECLPAILMLEEANKNLQGKDNSVSGLVKITAPEDLGYSVISTAIANLALKYPTLNFELHFTDHIVDIINDGFDVAVRLGKVKDSGLMLKQAGEVILIAVASPKYLKGKKKISIPIDLKEHICLSHFWSKEWTMKSNKTKLNIKIETKIFGNQMMSMIKMASEGCGVAFVPKYLCEPQLKSGELVQVLSQWNSPPIQVSIITPMAPSTTARIRVTVDAISNAISNALK